MRMTIAQLAGAVQQKESYVRQHINRKHLNVHREGRKVSVDLIEASRWAQEWGLTLSLPAHVIVPTGYMESRIARTTVLSWHPGGNANGINIFTSVRHRRQDALGPWASEADGIWASEVILADSASESGEFRLYTLDSSLKNCQILVDRILNEGMLDIDGVTVEYSLEQPPRLHWVYRDERSTGEHSFRSPFLNHSAEVTEYWNFSDEPRNRWLKITEARPANLEALTNRLGFPLDLRSDRVGNLLIAGAEDTIHCDLTAQNNTLILSIDRIDGLDLLSDQYAAAVWGSHSGDIVVRCEVPVTGKEIVIDLRSDVDHIGFAIHRNLDGQCIDLMETNLVMRIGIAMHVDSGPTLEVRDLKNAKTHSLRPSSSRSMLNIDADKYSPALDRQIRRSVLDRRIVERESRAVHERELKRFEADEFDAAAEYFINLLRQHSYQNEPIYLADAHFKVPDFGDAESQLYLDMFQATTGMSLRILCSPKTAMAPWRTSYPFVPTRNVNVRTFIQPQARGRVLHDRYLITHDREILITNSFSGWRKQGVTFVSLPGSVYRSQAERLWEMEIGESDDGINVSEV